MSVTTLRKHQAGTSLEYRIAQALSADDASSAALNALLPDIRVAAAETQTKLDAATARALDPRAGSAAAYHAREEADGHTFALERLAASESAVRKAAAAAKNREDAETYETRRAEVRIERDALAAELTEKYPRLAAELCDLFQRIEQCDRRASGFGLASVDSEARGIEDWMLMQRQEFVKLGELLALPAFRRGWIRNHRMPRESWVRG